MVIISRVLYADVAPFATAQNMYVLFGLSLADVVPLDARGLDGLFHSVKYLL